MITLRAVGAEAVILPEQGAAFAALRHAGRDLLVPVPPGEDPNRGFHGSFLMAPWTNRLDGGRIVVAGTEHRLPVNRPDEGTAIHGFLRDMPWTVLRADDGSALLACTFDHVPFAGEARLAANLSAGALHLSVGLTNRGGVPTPMGLGWHPYFPRPAGTRLSAAARVAFRRDERNLPIEPRPSAGVDGSDEALQGLDTHFAGWDGVARIAWPDGYALTLHATGAWAANLQVFAPPHAAVLAVEPVSHAPDAPNRAASAAHGAMHVVDPGATLSASLMIHWQ
ncbi:aldose epimerase family protein [Falsiroseomonas oryzae]|uniref:aldose epimerase family protein n=1 Tax=Falsiroseomonas oryzae TaxID=2766473 RepID=UPI0022EAA0E4|nr:aldose epimerase [Roseomonas sp. MO-31]